MATMQQTQSKLDSFLSLRWYSQAVTFLFSFLAITSEPLLAAGIVLSAIDFLQRGQLLAHNPVLAGAWSIAQGLAMEVSVGPVLKNTLDARKEQDRVKTWLYGVLAGFLFTVGGAMLFLQFTESIMGVSETQLPGAVLIALFIARTVASLGYIALACTKNVTFSGKAGNAGNGVTNSLPTSPVAFDLEALIERLDDRYSRQMETQRVTIIEQIEQIVTRVTTIPASQLPQDTGPVIPALPVGIYADETPLQAIADANERETLMNRLVETVSGVSRQEIEQVLAVYGDYRTRSEIRAKLGWQGRKYTEVLKPILDGIDHWKSGVTVLPAR